MGGIDLFCASPASTAICMSMDQGCIVYQGGPAIDRHNPHIRDERRSRSGLTPAPSQPPVLPKSYPHQKSRKSSAAKSTDKSRNKRSSEKKPTDQISPPGSSRYLLSDTAFIDVLTDSNPSSSLVPAETSVTRSANPDESPVLKASSSTRHDQVVVLRVSLHCRGCEGKVRKHISRMQGVTSFTIDFATKKVTVIGNVTPLGVLASVSKVKKAQLWPSPTSSTPSLGSTH